MKTCKRIKSRNSKTYRIEDAVIIAVDSKPKNLRVAAVNSNALSLAKQNYACASKTPEKLI